MGGWAGGLVEGSHDMRVTELVGAGGKKYEACNSQCQPVLFCFVFVLFVLFVLFVSICPFVFFVPFDLSDLVLL